MTSDSLMRLNSTPPPSRRQAGTGRVLPLAGAAPRPQEGVGPTHNPRVIHAVTAPRAATLGFGSCEDALGNPQENTPGEPGTCSWRTPPALPGRWEPSPGTAGPAPPGQSWGDWREGKGKEPRSSSPGAAAHDVPRTRGAGPSLPARGAVFAGRSRRRGPRSIPLRPLLPWSSLPASGRPRQGRGAPAHPPPLARTDTPGDPKQKRSLRPRRLGLPKPADGNTMGTNSALGNAVPLGCYFGKGAVKPPAGAQRRKLCQGPGKGTCPRRQHVALS